MAQRRRNCVRVLGPYAQGHRWRVIVVDPEGKRDRHDFSTAKEAGDVALALQRELGVGSGGSTVDRAINEYELYMRNEKGNKLDSAYVTAIRMRRFFVDPDLPISKIDRKLVEAYYERLRTTPTRTGKPMSVDSHRNMLSEARTFLKWCVKRGWLASNPADGVEGKGRRRHGKAQLRIDEARAWMAKAVEYADAGEAGAIAAMMALLMGMRAGEIISRVVRDLDDEGRLLWIPTSKTEAGRRMLQVPDQLRPYLLNLAEGKQRDALLFGNHWRDFVRKWVARICHEANVPVVSAHGMRGLHSTLALEVGITAHAVAAALGHHSPSVTIQSYAKPEAVDSARQQRVLKVFDGGRKR
jgi:integrase